RKLAVGKHVLAAHVHHVGVPTRLSPAVPPFLAVAIEMDGKPMKIDWKCHALHGYRSQVRRINPQLSWIEWNDTRQNPSDWKKLDFDDRQWAEPARVDLGAARFDPPTIAPVQNLTHSLNAFVEGTLVETFGYELDDVPARFFLRDLL